MENWQLSNGRFVTEEGIISGDLYIQQGKIIAFIPQHQEISSETKQENSVERVRSLDGSGFLPYDCGGALVGPGFIDLHVHGGGGANVMEASFEAFEQMAVTHGEQGTTRFLLTTVTAGDHELLKVCQTAKRWKESLASGNQHQGALPLGIHLEGPYIALEKKGAQNGEYVRPFSMSEFSSYQQASGELIKLITLAPELLEHPEQIRVLRDQGVVVSVGHTNASYEEMERAVQFGASHVTHLCNAMPGIHHRNPGPIPFALLHEGVSVEFIADGIHVHPALIRLACKAKEHKGVAIVTDAISAAGMGDGQYDLGGLAVQVEQGKATLEDGTLAGSCLTMSRAYSYLHKEVEKNAQRIFQMMSSTPAAILGLDHILGKIKSGYWADLVLFQEGQLEAVMVAGKWIKGGDKR